MAYTAIHNILFLLLILYLRVVATPNPFTDMLFAVGVTNPVLYCFFSHVKPSINTVYAA